jgi:hypothetical protein
VSKRNNPHYFCFKTCSVLPSFSTTHTLLPNTIIPMLLLEEPRTSIMSSSPAEASDSTLQRVPEATPKSQILSRPSLSLSGRKARPAPISISATGSPHATAPFSDTQATMSSTAKSRIPILVRPLSNVSVHENSKPRLHDRGERQRSSPPLTMSYQEASAVTSTPNLVCATQTKAFILTDLRSKSTDRPSSQAAINPYLVRQLHNC